MKKRKSKENDTILLYKKVISNNSETNKNKKYTIVSTLDTQNYINYKEKPHIKSSSTRELKKINNYRINNSQSNNTKDNNINKKVIPSFKGSSFPIFLSSMTNTKNNLKLINYKFKDQKRNKSNSLNNNSLSNYSILFNNSNIYNQKIEDNGNNNSIQSKNNNNNKLNLKINFPKLKNIYNIKLISSRNIQKKNFFNNSEDRNLSLLNNNNNISRQSNNDIYNLKKKYKFHNYTMDSDLERYFRLNQKMKEINEFSKKKLQNILYKKINEKINISEKIKTKRSEDKNSYNSLNRNLNKIKPKIFPKNKNENTIGAS